LVQEFWVAYPSRRLRLCAIPRLLRDERSVTAPPFMLNQRC
jgi:hypothetical protein